MKIVENKARCKKCGDIIKSESVHDFQTCNCEAISVDGGHEYLKRTGDPDLIEELSKTEAE